MFSRTVSTVSTYVLPHRLTTLTGPCKHFVCAYHLARHPNEPSAQRARCSAPVTCSWSAEWEAVFAELDSRGDRDNGVEPPRSLGQADRCTGRFCAKRCRDAGEKILEEPFTLSTFLVRRCVARSSCRCFVCKDQMGNPYPNPFTIGGSCDVHSWHRTAHYS